jgi:hypothetical protein
LQAIAEELLKNLQTVMMDRAEAIPSNAPGQAVSPRHKLKTVEKKYGPAATQYGRRLHDLLLGSPAWSLFDRSTPLRSRVIPIQQLSRCAPLLKIMRESGELAERERLLAERDQALVSTWNDSSLSPYDREQRANAAYDGYAAELSALARTYRPYYHKLRRAMGTIVPLAAPRVRARPMLQPPLMALLFAACHADKDDFLQVELEAGDGYAYRRGPHSISIESAQRCDTGIDEGVVSSSGLNCIAEPRLASLDDMTWDIAAIAICAFFARTSGSDPDQSFPLLLDDYFDWRGVDLRKRSFDIRKQIDARVRLLCSNELEVCTENLLWLKHPQGYGRVKTAVSAQGTILGRVSALYRPSIWRSEAESEPFYGYLVTLGSWARKLIEERAMIGVFPKRLAEYDLRRQQWERRIGWYLTFQMQSQGSKMRFEESAEDGNKVLRAIPQHSLRMRTVLLNSHVGWERIAATNAGKVIDQWVSALDTLRADGVIGPYSCLDGALDGSDLPVRGRLAAMLDRRYEFTPGDDMIYHVRARAATRAKLRRSR